MTRHINKHINYYSISKY